MRTKALINHFHDLQPIYSAHFEPGAKGRLATAGGDNNVRIWQIHELPDGEIKVVYLSTLSRHTQAVNVVRFSPKNPVLASAGDDGVVCIWVPSEKDKDNPAFGESSDHAEDKEFWRVKHLCRAGNGSEIYDLVWSPDGTYILTGSMDNIARIYDSRDGQCIRVIGEHSHYVQGVAWDPLGEYIATQSSDRSVHIWALKTRDGQLNFQQYNRSSRIDLPPRRISGSPAPPDMPPVSTTTRSTQVPDTIAPSPTPSTPGTPTSVSLPMNPPPFSTSRRSSFSGSPAQSSISAFRRSASPSPALPLPAVKPSTSPKAQTGPKSTYLFHNEALLSFFRRLSFSTDGSLLLAPAGQYKAGGSNGHDVSHKDEEPRNTVFVYTRAGLNKPPVAHLPGHKKPSIAVRFSPIYYKLRTGPAKVTENLTIDTSSDGTIPALPPPVVETEPPSPEGLKPGSTEPDNNSGTVLFSLPYRMVYAIATQDSVLIYDTQQHTPICAISNLHYATFTDLTWSTDGNMLIMTSTDGFCSTVLFEAGELGEIHPGPAPTPLSSLPLSRPSPSSISNPSFPTPPIRATSPTRSNSSSSVATVSAFSTAKISTIPPIALSAPSPTSTFVQPTVMNTGSSNRNASISSTGTNALLSTPPDTPGSIPPTKREGEGTSGETTEEEPKSKKRRIAPTLISPAEPK